MSNLFNIDNNKNHKVAVITFTCDTLTAVNGRTFKLDVLSAMNGEYSDCSGMILDMESIKFVDSSGLGALIGLLRASATNRKQFALANLTKAVQSLFELMRMHKVFDVFDNVDQALLRY